MLTLSIGYAVSSIFLSSLLLASCTPHTSPPGAPALADCSALSTAASACLRVRA